MKRTDSRCIRPVFLGFVSIWRKEPVGGMPQGEFCRSAGRVQVPRLWDTCVAREPHLRYICSTQVSYKRGINAPCEGRCIVMIFSALFCFLLFRAEA